MISIELLRESLNYNPLSGEFTWKKKACLKVNVGSVAGHTNKDGYIVIKVGGFMSRAHRLAWFIFYGVMPEKCIDHIDGDRSNNRIKNLRDVSHYDNNKNQTIPKSNQSGVMGVTYDKNKRKNKYRARIKDKGVNIHIGYFENIELAKLALNKKRSELGFHKNHGRK